MGVTDDGHLRVWDSATGALLQDVSAQQPLGQLALAPDGVTAAAAGADGVVRLFDLRAGRWTESFAWHTAAVTGLAWVGESLASGGADGKVAVWNVAPPIKK